jgi:hypothetical protein
MREKLAAGDDHFKALPERYTARWVLRVFARA